ncbi:MAG: hypothetical protein K5796_04685 [Lachnospiraceae bacterium]|nr:hypothetical protein [Lachnospiraceae bacterium]
MEDKAKKQVKIIFAVRILLWIIAFASTLVWVIYNFKLNAEEISDPAEFAARFRPLFYTCLGISVIAVCVAFALYMVSKKIKEKNGIK